MTTTAHTLRTRSRIRFALHYVEMVVAMVVGMMVLAPVWTLLWPASAAAPFAVQLAVMATNMAIGMAVPMLLRRHSWRSIAEMSASMYAAFLVVLVPYWAGLVDTEFVMLWGHVLMLPAMLAVMLLRPGHGH